MTATGYIRGRKVTWDAEAEVYRWNDNDQPAVAWGGAERPCPLCGLTADSDDGVGGADPCLGTLPDCDSACCGHGAADGWISRPQGCVRFRVVSFAADAETSGWTE